MATMLQIDQMTLEEKLRAMEALWDDLCQREEDVPVPQWHKDLLDERERSNRAQLNSMSYDEVTTLRR
jgi:hypothetical protein